MRLEAILWTIVAIFYGTIGLFYLALTGEAVGSTVLLAGVGFGGLVAGWLWNWFRTNEPRAEDVADADSSHETGIVGVYPSASLRPLGVAVGMTAVVLGVVVGIWMTVTGVALVASQVVLLVRDADR